MVVDRKDEPNWRTTLETGRGKRITCFVWREWWQGLPDYRFSWRAEYLDEKTMLWRPMRFDLAGWYAQPRIWKKVMRWVERDQRKLAAARAGYETGKLPVNENQMRVLELSGAARKIKVIK